MWSWIRITFSRQNSLIYKTAITVFISLNIEQLWWVTKIIQVNPLFNFKNIIYDNNNNCYNYIENKNNAFWTPKFCMRCQNLQSIVFLMMKTVSLRQLCQILLKFGKEFVLAICIDPWDFLWPSPVWLKIRSKSDFQFRGCTTSSIRHPARWLMLTALTGNDWGLEALDKDICAETDDSKIHKSPCTSLASRSNPSLPWSNQSSLTSKLGNELIWALSS